MPKVTIKSLKAENEDLKLQLIAIENDRKRLMSVPGLSKAINDNMVLRRKVAELTAKLEELEHG